MRRCELSGEWPLSGQGTQGASQLFLQSCGSPWTEPGEMDFRGAPQELLLLPFVVVRSLSRV